MTHFKGFVAQSAGGGIVLYFAPLKKNPPANMYVIISLSSVDDVLQGGELLKIIEDLPIL